MFPLQSITVPIETQLAVEDQVFYEVKLLTNIELRSSNYGRQLMKDRDKEMDPNSVVIN